MTLMDEYVWLKFTHEMFPIALILNFLDGLVQYQRVTKVNTTQLAAGATSVEWTLSLCSKVRFYKSASHSEDLCVFTVIGCWG